MNRVIFDAITDAALTVTDYQLELTAMKYAAIERKESLYLTASNVRGHEALMTAWADSFFIPIDPFSTLKNKAIQAKKDYVHLFSAHAESPPNDKATDIHALDAYKLSMQAANEQFRCIYLDTKDLSRALTAARQTFKTEFTVRLNQFHSTHFMDAMASPNNIVGGMAAMSPTTPERKARASGITKPTAVSAQANDTCSLDDALNRLKI